MRISRGEKKVLNKLVKRAEVQAAGFSVTLGSRMDVLESKQKTITINMCNENERKPDSKAYDKG